MIRNWMQKLILIALVLVPAPLFANGLSLSVTPTLFEMSAKPFQQWSSSVRVINPNRQELAVYAEVVNFMPQGETGHGKFMPVFEDFTEGKTLAEWITVPEEPIIIAPEGTASVPVHVKVPEDAAPGGHYAAILIKTQPPENDGSLQIGTAQAVTSLFLVRIAGEVVENGTVRTFTVDDSFVSLPEANFEVRFENKGNIHLQPQGEIVISNMWGKERGVIPINHQTHFGNVLPESIRKFEFTWKGEPSFTDIGRYKAELTLGYGFGSRKFTTKTTHFWVIPVKQVLVVLGVFVFILWFVSWAIRAYVRRMLALSGVSEYVPPSQRARVAERGDVVIGRRTSVAAPIEEGVRDFRSRIEHTRAFMDTLLALFRFVLQYKYFFGGSLVFVVAVMLIWQFITSVTEPQRDYEVIIENPGAEVTLSSEEIIYDQQQTDHEVSAEAVTENGAESQTYELVLTNSGDTPGAAAALQKELENEGYSVASLRSDFGESKERTVIIYDVSVQEEALTLSQRLGNALLSARPEVATSTLANVTVLIGNDYEF